MPRKIFTFALPLICSLASAHSFALTITSGHTDFTIAPTTFSQQVIVGTVEAAPLVVAWIPGPIQSTVLYESTLTHSTTGTLTLSQTISDPITLSGSSDSGSGTMTIPTANISAVPLAGGGVYLATALLPFAARLARRR